MSPGLKNTPFSRLLRAMIEIGFIIFLFYSNLLMGEFTRSNAVPGKTFMLAINDILTLTNFIIANITAIIGFFVFEFLRKKFN
jgi:hypothetical protein